VNTRNTFVPEVEPTSRARHWRSIAVVVRNVPRTSSFLSVPVSVPDDVELALEMRNAGNELPDRAD